VRLAAVRDLLARAAELARLIDASGAVAGLAPPTDEVVPEERRPDSEVRAPAAERRRALAVLLDVWRDLGRDLALVSLGDVRRLHDPGLLEELEAASIGLSERAIAAFLRRLDRAGEQLDANVSPELLADSLILAWPRAEAAA
jgi:hypothetical protein